MINTLDYKVLPLPVSHHVSTVGYQVTSRDGKSLFYTSDTGPGLASCWQHVSPQLLITEVSGPQRLKSHLRGSGHLTPGLLRKELEEFYKTKGYLPRVILVHLPPPLEAEIADEVSQIDEELSGQIELGRDGMRISI